MKIPNLYVCSIESYCGKSAFCLGLALTLKDAGYKIGYFKPIGWEMARTLEGEKIDEDALLMKEILNLDVPLDIISPIVLGTRFLEESSKNKPDVYKHKVLRAYEKASKNMDLMILEGPYSLGVGTSVGVDSITLTSTLNSHLVIISRVENDAAIDRLLWKKKCLDALGGNLIGVVLNCVPKTLIERVKGFGAPILQRHNVNVLGIIPDNTSLRAPTVGEICDTLACTILTGEDKMDLLVEDLLVGAMTPESALSYFRKSLRKAVITGGDRADIQLAALQTDTSVLILTGNFYPDVRVLARAEELGVPVLLVPFDTYTTVREIATLSGRIQSRDTEKIQIANKLVNEHVDWKKILSSLLESV